MTRLPALLAALVVGAGVLVGCGGPGRPQTGSRPIGHRTITLSPLLVPRGVTLSFLQQRIDEGTSVANVRVTNGSRTRAIRVRSVALRWPGYPHSGKQRVGYSIGPGQTVDFRYLLPRPDCSRRAGSSAPRLVAALTGRTVRRALPADGLRFLHSIHRAACDRIALARAARIRLVLTDRANTPEVLEAQVRLTRRYGRAPVRLTHAQGSVLFDFGLPRPGGLSAEARSASVPVLIDPGRCDEHARSQASQPFNLRVWIRLRGPRELAAPLRVDRAAQAELLAFLDRACAGITSH